MGTVPTDALGSLGDGGSLPYGLPILSLNVCTRRAIGMNSSSSSSVAVAV